MIEHENLSGPDVFRAVFNEDAVEELKKFYEETHRHRTRLYVIDANGPYPEHIRKDPCHPAYRYKATKMAWDDYLNAAYLTGMLKGEHGKELISKLRSADNAHFRGAMAQCMAAWWCAGKLGHQIMPNPPGRGNRVLDFAVAGESDVMVEVKSPYHKQFPDKISFKRPKSWTEVGDDSNVLRQSLEEAKKQFLDTTPNLLVIVPDLRQSVSQNRYQFLKAFFGESVIKVPLSKVGFPDSEQLEPYAAFKHNGKFFRRDFEATRFLHTRLSAVAVLEEVFIGFGDGMRRKLNAFVINNPNAKHPLLESFFGDAIQLVGRDGEAVWTDGKVVGL